MSSFDFDSAMRILRSVSAQSRARREDHDLAFLSDGKTASGTFLLDTCVYIDAMRGRAPPEVIDLVTSKTVNHSTVAIQEMMHGVGQLDPSDPRTEAVIRQVKLAITGMHRHRIQVPDADIHGRSGLLSGLLCRVQGYGVAHRHRALHDCILYLQARKTGMQIVTANITDFDILQQIMPGVGVLFYRAV